MNNSFRNRVMHFTISISLLLIMTGFIYAQSGNQNYYWMNFGLGLGSVGEDGEGGMAIHFNFAYEIAGKILTLRMLDCGQLFGRSLDEISFLYGKGFDFSKVYISFGGGIGMVKGSISHGIFSESKTTYIGPTTGLPLEMQVQWRPFRLIGLGLYGFANINSEESFYGATLSLYIGKLR